MNYRRMRKAIAIRRGRLNILLKEEKLYFTKTNFAKFNKKLNFRIHQGKVEVTKFDCLEEELIREYELEEEIRKVKQELCRLHYRIFCYEEEKRK